MISYRLHKRGEVILAMADKELLGKTFSEGDFILKISDFFKGDFAEKEVIMGIIESATIINAVGEKSTRAVIDAGLATQSALKRVDGIPHIQVAFVL